VTTDDEIPHAENRDREFDCRSFTTAASMCRNDIPGIAQNE
jgi:hypothetical protein